MAGILYVAVLTHRRVEDTHAALGALIERARAVGATLRFDAEETVKHGLRAEPGVEVDTEIGGGAEQLCIVLGGDGTILRALQLYAGSSVPVFAINFGEIGFLATVEPEEIEDGVARALSGSFELLRLPGIVLETALRRGDRDQRRRDPPPRWRARGGVGVRARR